MFGQSPIELLATDAMLRGAIFCNSFDYTAVYAAGTPTALGANATIDNLIQITAEADFVVQQINGISWTVAGTMVVDPDYTVMISVASGRPWFNQPQDFRTRIGSYASAANPGLLNFPRLIASQSTITVTLANRTAVAANRVTVSLQGFNVYYQTENRQQVFHAL